MINIDENVIKVKPLNQTVKNLGDDRQDRVNKKEVKFRYV